MPSFGVKLQEFSEALDKELRRIEIHAGHTDDYCRLQLIQQQLKEILCARKTRT